MNTDYYTVAQVADKLQCPVSTVQLWVRSGQLKAIYLSGRRNIRIDGADLEEFLENRKKGEPDGERDGGLPSPA